MLGMTWFAILPLAHTQQRCFRFVVQILFLERLVRDLERTAILIPQCWYYLAVIYAVHYEPSFHLETQPVCSAAAGTGTHLSDFLDASFVAICVCA
jgi:hypothetical protein